MKNSEVKDEFKAKGLAEAKEALDVMHLSEEQLYGYNRYLDYLHVKASEAFSLKIEAEEKIRRETAQKAIEKGLDNETIADISGLPTEEIQRLRTIS